MSKKIRVLLIILPCIAFFAASIVKLVLPTYIDVLPNNDYSLLTVYEDSYYSETNFWWMHLAFLPLCIFSLAIGLKNKDAIVNIASILVIVI